MRLANEEIRQRIIDAARGEFLDNGFEKASIRTITARAKTSKSNLYNYFHDKDDLFCAVLEPVTAEISAGLVQAKQYNMPKETGDYTFSSQQFVIGVISRFIAEHTGDVKLLLFQAQGSSLAGFKYEILDLFTGNMEEWTRSVHTRKNVSRLFVRTVCSFYLNMIEQLLLVGPPADMPQFMKEISVFVYNGWKSVFLEE
jgi:AcrR family transcriptional regulator